MRRGLIAMMVLAMLVSSVSLAWAGGRYHYHENNGAFWWGLGAGAALGTLGALAPRPYFPVAPPYPVYPPVVVPPPQPMIIHLYCPAYQAYYPYVPACPMPWVQVRVPY